jgi:hypothetical protein
MLLPTLIPTPKTNTANPTLTLAISRIHIGNEITSRR